MKSIKVGDGMGMSDMNEKFLPVHQGNNHGKHPRFGAHPDHKPPRMGGRHPDPMRLIDPIHKPPKSLFVKAGAEFFGTFVFVLFGAGSVVLPPTVTDLEIALTFGGTLLFLIYAIGPISGCHVNPAVSLGVYLSNFRKGKFGFQDLMVYWLSQFLGGITGAAILFGLCTGRPDYDISVNGLGENGWGPGYASQYNLASAFMGEIIFTFLFLVNILSVTREGADHDPTTNGLSIGLTLAAIHLAFLPITGVSLNPARSFAVAIFVGGKGLNQVWLFFIAPFMGSALAALFFRSMHALKNPSVKKFVFELLGTFTLVLIGVGSVVFPTDTDRLSTSFAFGFALVSIAYTIGPFSGGHVNPAVTFGVWISKPQRDPNAFRTWDVPLYWLGQFIGGILGAATMYALVVGREGYNLADDGLGVNGWGDGYGANYRSNSAFFIELVLTFVFLVNIIGSTTLYNTAMAGLSIGLTLAVIHIIALPITGTSVNPARSLGPALIVGGKSLRQVPLFLFAPILGAALGGLVFRFKMFDKPHPGLG